MPPLLPTTIMHSGARRRGPGGRPRPLSTWAALVFAASVAGFLVAPRAARPAPLDSSLEEIECSLYLLGDAGVPARGGEPVLKALRNEVLRATVESMVVFLGDNVYSGGLPPAGMRGRAEAERRIDAQIDAVSGTAARGIFIPGNHDWEGGIAGVLREANRVAERGGPSISFLPRVGSPGPAVVDIGRGLRLVILDSEVIIRKENKQGGGQETAADESLNVFTDSLRAAIVSAGERRVVVLAHHPLASGGHHGGHFGWRDHIFPLREIRSALWLPLPVVGSIYPLARNHGASPQDQSHPANRRMRERIEAALQTRRPLVYACGHEHNLQVLEGGPAEYLLVSGAGAYHHTTPVFQIPGTKFALRKAGFLRLDLMASGRVRLVVLAVGRGGDTAERFEMWLDGPKAAGGG